MRSLKNKKMLRAVVVAMVLGSLTYYAWPAQKAAAPPGKSQAVTPTTPTVESGFNKDLYPTAAPDSIWVVVNKQHPLNPISYAPSDLTTPNVPLRVPGNESMRLRAEPAHALEQMFAAAKPAGLQLMISSGYRSYTYQVGLYNGYVKSEGQTLADQQSARPGHSEHQTGLAADIEPASRSCELSECFATTPEGKWLADNSYKYGFILRYTADKVSVTGYEYEPWHFRYVGLALAQQMHDKDIKTLEEFFSISGGTSY